MTRKSPRSRLTEQEKEEANRMWQAGVSLPTIARYFGIDRKAVQRAIVAYNPKRDAVGNRRDPASPRLADNVRPHLPDIFGRYQAGETIEEMAAEYGVSPAYLHELLRTAGMPVRAMPGRGRRYKNIGPLEFIDTWQNATTPTEVAEKLRMPLNAVLARAYSYQRRGVPLRRLKAMGHNWAELAEFAKSLLE